MGLIFSHNLKFSNQYKKIFSVFSYFYATIKFLSFKLNKPTLSKIYLSFFLPVIEYCHVVYIHFNKNYFYKLNKVNFKILKLTDLNPQEFSLHYRLLLSLIKISLTVYTKNIPALTIVSNSCSITRSYCILPSFKLSIYKHSLHYIFSKLLNFLHLHNLLQLKVPSSIAYNIFTSTPNFDVFDIFL